MPKSNTKSAVVMVEQLLPVNCEYCDNRCGSKINQFYHTSFLNLFSNLMFIVAKHSFCTFQCFYLQFVFTKTKLNWNINCELTILCVVNLLLHSHIDTYYIRSYLVLYQILVFTKLKNNNWCSNTNLFNHSGHNFNTFLLQ